MSQELLVERLSVYGWAHSQSTLMNYLTKLLQWNKAMNLSGAQDMPTLIEEHVADALPLAKLLPSDAVTIDVGSGAGFPALVIAAVRPDITLTLVEKHHKKCVFLREIIRTCKLRATVREESITPPAAALCGNFEVAFSRAVFAPSLWLSYGAPLLQPNGLIYALLAEDTPPAAPEGLVFSSAHSYSLSTGATRKLACYRKNS